MSAPGCERFSIADLSDYLAGDVAEADSAAIEAHLFTCAACAARAAELDALVHGVKAAVRSGEVDGFITDTILNRLSRDGVRVRSFTLSPGAVVPCAVWEGDELMALRLRADLGGATEVTLVHRQAGAEVSRTTTALAPGAHGEVIFATAASQVRQLPEVELQLELTSAVNGEERVVGRYTLVHGGAFHR
jgi:anti-sigma factor RsiW